MKRPQVLGKAQNGLYVLLPNCKPYLIDIPKSNLLSSSIIGCCKFFSPFSAFTSQSSRGFLDLWHYRLGHLPFDKLCKLELGDEIKRKEHDTCFICPKARQTRFSFPLSNSSSSSIFDLVHIDVWGPYHTVTFRDCKYFLTLVDDYSRFTWTHLLHNKSSALTILKSFVKMIQTQFGSTVKAFRSDNAFELGSSKAAQDYFQSEGILHQTTIRHTPQQNGVVERKHRHLLEVCRALLFQSNLPLCLWGHCLLTATYLINRFPSTILKEKTPYEMLFKYKPSYIHLRTFGCLCFVSTQKPGRDKLQPRAIPCVMIGYPINQKGYKVFDLTHKRVFVSRDVIFHEKVFPYHLSSWNHFHGTSSLPLPVSDVTSDIPVTSSSSGNHDASNYTIFEHSNMPDTSSSMPDDGASFPSSNLQTRRRSHRTTKQPHYLQDYVCNSTIARTPVLNFPVPSATFSTSIHSNSSHKHHNFVSKDHNDTATQLLFEPLTYEDAAVIPAWQTAMQQEFDALIANDTWDLVSLPQGKKPIGCKWVYRIKRRADGSIERCKARLVAKGFTQKEGVDYSETF